MWFTRSWAKHRLALSEHALSRERRQHVANARTRRLRYRLAPLSAPTCPSGRRGRRPTSVLRSHDQARQCLSQRWNPIAQRRQRSDGSERRHGRHPSRPGVEPSATSCITKWLRPLTPPTGAAIVTASSQPSAVFLSVASKAEENA